MTIPSGTKVSVSIAGRAWAVPPVERERAATKMMASIRSCFFIGFSLGWAPGFGAVRKGDEKQRGF